MPYKKIILPGFVWDNFIKKNFFTSIKNFLRNYKKNFFATIKKIL